jgi:hypothetical protein
MNLKPTVLSKDQILSVVKVILWVAVSGAVTALATQLTDRQDLFGPLYPVVNIGLVLLKQVFTTPK